MFLLPFQRVVPCVFRGNEYHIKRNLEQAFVFRCFEILIFEVNSHNVRQYAPRVVPPDFHHERQKVTVWMGVCGNGTILGPFFFARSVDGNTYLELLNNNIIRPTIN